MSPMQQIQKMLQLAPRIEETEHVPKNQKEAATVETAYNQHESI